MGKAINLALLGGLGLLLLVAASKKTSASYDEETGEKETYSETEEALSDIKAAQNFNEAMELNKTGAVLSVTSTGREIISLSGAEVTSLKSGEAISRENLQVGVEQISPTKSGVVEVRSLKSTDSGFHHTSAGEDSSGMSYAAFVN